MENLARYIIRASFSQERMTYLRDESKVLYQSKDAKQTKTFDALEWLAAMCSHVPNRGEQMVRYYGHYSNVKRGKRKKEVKDEIIPCIIEESGVSPAKRKAWARLIQKIYEVDPLTCPKCRGPMKIIAFIEREEIIEKILKYLGLWLVKTRPPPRTHLVKIALILKSHLLMTTIATLTIHLKPICKTALQGLQVRPAQNPVISLTMYRLFLPDPHLLFFLRTSHLPLQHIL